jgi:hypothetical protein
MELESWFALRTTEQLFCFLALLFKGKIQEVAVDPAAMRGVPARRAPPLHYLHEHAWRRGPATPKDSPSHRTCTGDPPKQEKITSERARIIQHEPPGGGGGHLYNISGTNTSMVSLSLDNRMVYLNLGMDAQFGKMNDDGGEGEDGGSRRKSGGPSRADSGHWRALGRAHVISP